MIVTIIEKIEQKANKEQGGRVVRGADPWRIFLGVKGEGQRRAQNADATVFLGLIKVGRIRAQDFRCGGFDSRALRSASPSN